MRARREEFPPRQRGTPGLVARRLAVAGALAAIAALPMACSATATSGSASSSSSGQVLREQASPAVSVAADPGPSPARMPKTLVSLPVRIDPSPFSCNASWGGEYPPDVEIRRLEELVRRSLGDARIHTCLANALFDGGRLAEAIREYREAIRLDGTLLEAHRNLAYALLDSGRREAALDVLARAVRLAPGDPALRVTMRSALRAMDRHP